MAELGKRLLSAVALAPPVALVVHLGGPWSAGLMALASAIGAAEFARLVGGRLLPSTAVAFVLPLLPLLGPARDAALGFWLVAALAIAAWLLELARAEPIGAPNRVGAQLAGALFPGLGLFALSRLRLGPHGEGWTYLVLIATWGNDAAAYLGGRALGKHKLAPRISPGKTWEGAAFGALGTAAAIAAIRALALPLTVLEAAGLTALLATAGVLGDLCKSVLKRACNAKNSGHLIPGHGGMLDRIDAVLFNALATAAFLALR